jgi:hypothetical protein
MLPARSPRRSPRTLPALSPRSVRAEAVGPALGKRGLSPRQGGVSALVDPALDNRSPLPPLSAAVQALRTKHMDRLQCRPRPQAGQLWRAGVKNWMDDRGKAKERELNQSDQHEASAWFTALDMDKSGSVEEDEIRALMDALGVVATRKDLRRMFASIGKGLDAELTKQEFIRFMTLNGPFLTGQKIQQPGKDLFDANTRLMMLSYRRRTLLGEWGEPSNRRHFADPEAFVNCYGQPLSGTLAVSAHSPPKPTPATPRVSAPPGARARPSLQSAAQGAVLSRALPPPPQPLQPEPAPVAEDTRVEVVRTEDASAVRTAGNAASLVPEWS